MARHVTAILEIKDCSIPVNAKDRAMRALTASSFDGHTVSAVFNAGRWGEDVLIPHFGHCNACLKKPDACAEKAAHDGKVRRYFDVNLLLEANAEGKEPSVFEIGFTYELSKEARVTLVGFTMPAKEHTERKVVLW